MYRDLAVMFVDRALLNGALRLEEESLAMRKRIFYKDHPYIGEGMNNLALT